MKIWTSFAMPDVILPSMICHRLQQEKEADLQNVENDFHSQKTFLFQQKKSEIIMLAFVKYLQIYLGTGVSTHM